MSSGVKRVAAPPVPSGAGHGKKHVGAPSANGSGPAPLMYSSGEPADDVNMNEVDDKLELNVVLPSGAATTVMVDSNFPMMDLLVHLAAKTKVSPSVHTLQVLDEERGKNLDYTPNQTIGSLGVSTVYLVPKNKKQDWSKPVKASSSFEMTQRFTINLPGRQKAVMRISPSLTLEQVLVKACQEKNLDARRYTLQHPAQPLTTLNMRTTVADFKLTEVNLIPVGMSTAASDYTRSMPDLSKGEAPYNYSTAYMPEAGEIKKKRGFLSFLKKEKKFKPPAAEPKHSSLQQSVLQTRKPTTPPPERRGSGSKVENRPKTMYVDDRGLQHPVGAGDTSAKAATLKPPLHDAGKKRPAPRPPGTSVQEASEPPARASTYITATSSPSKESAVTGESVPMVHKAAPDVMVSRLHSRNSSDSSGYHELTLSGTESPEAGRLRPNFKTSIDTTSIESTEVNGDSGIHESSPLSASSRVSKEEDIYAVPMKSKTKQMQQTAEKLKPLPSTKKKKAPPPPPSQAPAKQEVVTSMSSGLQEPGPSHAAASSSPVSTTELAATASATTVVTEEIPDGTELHPSDNIEVFTAFKEPQSKEGHTDSDREEAGEAFSLEDILEGIALDDEPLQKTVEEREEDWEKDEQENQLMMVETESVLSEDVQEPEDFRLRPCEFNPPPPPEEPPPDEEYPSPDYSPAVQRKFADKSTVVGEDNASLAPLSLKSSPIASRRRRDSQSSLDSVDTVEGVSLAFQEIISAAEEAMEAERWMEGGSEYKNEMAIFVEQMSEVAGQADRDQLSNDASGSVQDTESISDTGSVICHHSVGHARETSFDSQSSLNSFGQSDDCGQSEDLVVQELDVQCLAYQDSAVENEYAMTEEICAPEETVLPPLEFRNSEDTEEEEEVVTVTEEYIVPLTSGGFDFGLSIKIPDLNTPKEPAVDMTRSIGVLQTKTEVMHSSAVRAEENATVKTAPKENPPKEEFVLTTEDLKNVSLLPLRPKLYSQPKAAPGREHKQVRGSWLTDIVLDEPRERPHVHLAYVSERSQQKLSAGGSQSFAQKQASAESRTVSSLQPVPQASQASFLLPSMRITSLVEPPAFSDDDVSSGSADDYRHRSAAKLVMESPDQGDDASSLTDSSSDRHSGTSSRRQSDASSSGSSAAARDPPREQQEDHLRQLQQDFARWQEQLLQNQAVLAQHSNNDEATDSDSSGSLHISRQQQTQLRQQAVQQQRTAQQQQTTTQNLWQQQRHRQQQQKQEVEPPPLSPSVAPQSAPKLIKTSTGPRQQRPPMRKFEPQLDPREELMIAIRSFGGREGLDRSKMGP